MQEFSDGTVVGMASFPPRLDSLEKCLARIAPQVDAIVLYLNEYNEIPHFLARYRNVYAILGTDSYGDLSAAGKMVALQHCKNCYFFSLDDDILVPPDYIARFKAAIDRYEGWAAFCVHGTVFSSDAEGYYERAGYFGWRDALRDHRLVTLAGSGTFAVHQSSFPATFEHFIGPLMVDLRVSLICRDNGVPLLSIERPPFWLEVNIQEGLWEQFRAVITHHTHVMREHRPWTFPRFAGIVTTMFDRHFGGFSREAARARNFDSEVTTAILRGWLPPGWGTDRLALHTRARHLRDFGR
jgi:hypothetical protein